MLRRTWVKAYLIGEKDNKAIHILQIWRGLHNNYKLKKK